MLSKSNRKTFWFCEAVAFLVLALSGCLGTGGGSPSLLGRGATPVDEPTTLSEGSGLGPEEVTATLEPPEGGGEPWSGLFRGQTGPATGDGVSEGVANSEDPGTGDALNAGTTPGSLRLADLPRSNPEAADLLDHWGHRPFSRIIETVSLTAPAAEDGAEALRALRTAAQTGDEASVVPDLGDDDEVQVLGAQRGITYGRWTGGPADTLSIDFTLSPAMQEKPGFRAMAERVGKAWSIGSPTPGPRGTGRPASSRGG